MTAYDVLFDRVLTRVEPERAHRIGFRAVRAGRPFTRALIRARSEPVEAMGLRFPNPLGLAAGFDKNAEGVDALGALGFGFVEVGTVTALPQPGNPQPRLFRLPADHAVVNRMGFNNDGAEAVAARLARRAHRLDRRARRATGRVSGGAAHRTRPVLGVNIGKSRSVPEDDEAAVIADHATSARLLAPYADYLVVNVSSPNTPGLRNLQAVDRLAPLLDEVRRVADDAAGRFVPLCV
jgi:dihydroorotate dehydrogenase